MSNIIEIEEPKKKVKEKVTYNPLIKRGPSPDTKLKIMRIEMEEDYTRIDFVYNNGKFAWVQIDPASFIRPVGSDLRLTLVKASGIPCMPNKKFFDNPNETLYYTLFFPALPKGTESIDIIEREAPGTYFNFYGVSMERVRKETIPVGN